MGEAGLFALIALPSCVLIFFVEMIESVYSKCGEGLLTQTVFLGLR